MSPTVQAALDLEVTSPDCAELIRFEGADCMAIDTDEYHNLFQARATLAAEVRRLEQENAELRKALDEAATSLLMIADQAGRDPYLHDIFQIRGYANSRAYAARALEGGRP